MTHKKHFKLYKSGKKWCIMAITVAAMAFGMAGVQNASADEVSNGVSTTEVTNDSNANSVVNTGSQTADQSTAASENNNQSSANSTASLADQNNTNNSSATEQNGQVNNQQQVAEPANGTLTISSQTVAKHSATTDTDQQNGWYKNSNGEWTYYTNGQVQSGRRYAYLPTITANGTGSGYNWYLVDNGVVQSGVQKWANTYYDFDSTTYLRVDNNYVRSQWGDWYMFGPDGRIATKVYKWAGTYYYFDPVTYLRVDNNYVQSQWGDWYMFGPDGQIATKVYKWAGTYYYFDPVTYLRVDNDYRQSQWGDWYLFGGDGRIMTGVHRWMGSVYYFDPVTYLRVDNAWREGLYFGADGRLVNGGFATRVINWFLQREGRLTYSMYGSRTGADGTADCSGSMTAALRSAGASAPQIIYSTETLHGYLLNNGYYLAYEGRGPVSLRYGDVIIWGHKAASLGGNGHTMVVTGTGDYQTVISTSYLTEGEHGTAVQEVYYNNYWDDDDQPYQYVYRLINPARN